jgi:hypothetical protein
MIMARSVSGFTDDWQDSFRRNWPSDNPEYLSVPGMGINDQLHSVEKSLEPLAGVAVNS